MSSHTISVSGLEAGRCKLPDWSASFLLYISSLRERGVLEKIGLLLRVARQGGYCGLDVFVFLVAMFCWLQVMLEPGGATVSAMLARLLGKLEPWLEAAGATRERTLVRADGAAAERLRTQRLPYCS